MMKINKKILKNIFEKRKEGKYFRKYDFGLVILIGGGEFYSGSPALSAMAALKTGCDMTQILAPKRAADIIASFSPNLAALPLLGDRLEEKHLPTLLSMTEAGRVVARGNVAVVIGGGTGRSEETRNVLLKYLSQVEVPVVIDADAIHALADNPDIVKNKSFLLTPHSYEFSILTGKEIYKLPHQEKQEIVKEEAEKMKTTILLKEKPDIVSNGKEIALNEIGSPYLSVGGTGDTLAGICGALMARRIDAFSSAQAGLYIICRAGQIAAQKLKEGMTATDVIDAIPEVLHE
jgi:hydroxyethylthiazole kinase-like uncharacterized protein yjeF